MRLCGWLTLYMIHTDLHGWCTRTTCITRYYMAYSQTKKYDRKTGSMPSVQSGVNTKKGGCAGPGLHKKEWPSRVTAHIQYLGPIYIDTFGTGLLQMLTYCITYLPLPAYIYMRILTNTTNSKNTEYRIKTPTQTHNSRWQSFRSVSRVKTRKCREHTLRDPFAQVTWYFKYCTDQRHRTCSTGIKAARGES